MSDMNRSIVTKTGIRVLIVIAVSTVLAYARLVGMVLSERLWRVPQRQMRVVRKPVSRRMG
jgi:hypothetical protein